MIIASDQTSTTAPEIMESHAEALRTMNICNACRYCEGLCATFQSMATRRSFVNEDMDYLANLCHNCTACFHDCQYAPPHEFAIHVPNALADVRAQSYARYAWPKPLARAFHKNGMVVFGVSTVVLAVSMMAALTLIPSSTLHGGAAAGGDFYTVIGHGLMVLLAGLPFLFSVVAMVLSVRTFWHSACKSDGKLAWQDMFAAVQYAGSLKYMDGGHGQGCSTTDDGFSNYRRYFHQFTMWGFLLCFAATSVGTIYHYMFGWEAPYDYTSLPVLLGTLGGIGLIIGPIGLMWQKHASLPELQHEATRGMDYAFLWSLLLVSLSGLLLLVLRETSAMGTLLIVHLALVLSFFLLLPYSKFVHGLYRFAALVHFAREQRTH